MPGSDGLRILVIFEKKTATWDLTLDEASIFLSLGEANPVVCYGMRRALLGQMEQSA